MDPTELLKAEPEEAICKVNLTLDVLLAFKACYEDHRARLPEYFDKVKDEHGQPTEPVLWEFKTELAFGRYDAFTERVRLVQVSQRPLIHILLPTVSPVFEGKCLNYNAFLLSETVSSMSQVPYSHPFTNLFALNAG